MRLKELELEQIYREFLPPPAFRQKPLSGILPDCWLFQLQDLPSVCI